MSFVPAVGGCSSTIVAEGERSAPAAAAMALDHQYTNSNNAVTGSTTKPELLRSSSGVDSSGTTSTASGSASTAGAGPVAVQPAPAPVPLPTATTNVRRDSDPTSNRMTPAWCGDSCGLGELVGYFD